MKHEGVVRAGKRIILIISNEDMDDTIRVIKSIENSGVIVMELVRQQNKK